LPFPNGEQPDLSGALEAFTPADQEGEPVTTVVVSPTTDEQWVPPLSKRYPGALASFARWAAAERVGEDRVIR
jgi:hypothetical protein